MATITLCGSLRFIKDFKREARRLTKEGNVVFTPELLHYPNPAIFTEEQHQVFDRLHEFKMDMSDYVYIINKGGYIGDNTRQEIEYCKRFQIPIKYMEN